MKKLDVKLVEKVIGGSGGKTCGRWNPSKVNSWTEERYCSPADKHGNYTGGDGWLEYQHR